MILALELRPRDEGGRTKLTGFRELSLNDFCVSASP